MFLTLIRIFPHPGQNQKIKGFLWGVVGPTRVQPGCLGCTLSAEIDPDAILYMERWESKKDLLRRLASEDFSKVLETMELSAVRPEVSIYEIVGEHGLELIEEVRSTSHHGRGVTL